MNIDKMREEFEAWANSFFANAPTKYKRDALPKDDPNYGDYVSMPLQAAWQAWQASRAALVVELPPAPVPQKRYEGRYTQVESAYHQGQMSVTRAIEAAGVRVKP